MNILTVTKTAAKTVTVLFDAPVTAASAVASSFYLGYDDAINSVGADSVAQVSTTELSVTAAHWPADPTGQPYYILDAGTAGNQGQPGPFYAGITLTLGSVSNADGNTLLAALTAATAGATIVLSNLNYAIGYNTFDVPNGVLLTLPTVSGTITSNYVGPDNSQTGSVNNNPRVPAKTLFNAYTNLVVADNGGRLKILGPEASYTNVDLNTFDIAGPLAAFQIPFGWQGGASASGFTRAPFTGVVLHNFDLVAESDGVYFQQQATYSATLGATLINCSATTKWDGVNTNGTPLFGTLTLTNFTDSALGPTTFGNGITRAISTLAPNFVVIVNGATTITSNNGTAGQAHGVRCQAGTVDLTAATGSITVSTSQTLNSLTNVSGVILINSQNVSYDRTNTSGNITGTLDTLTASKSGADVSVTFTFTHADHFKLNRDGAGFGSNVSSPQTESGDSSGSHSYVVRAYDLAGSYIAQGTATFAPPSNANSVANPAANLLVLGVL